MDLPTMFGFPRPELPATSRAVGKGCVVQLGFDLEQCYRDAIEQAQPAEAARLRTLLARLLAPIQANATVADQPAQMEVGVRQGREMALVIVINHGAKDNEGTATVRDLGFRPTWARRLFTGDEPDGMAPVKLASQSADGCTFRVKLPPRQAALILLAPRQPVGLPRLP